MASPHGFKTSKQILESSDIMTAYLSKLENKSLEAIGQTVKEIKNDYHERRNAVTSLFFYSH